MTRDVPHRSLLLSQLLQDIVSLDEQQERTIEGLSSDSRTVRKGELFIALTGEHFDARRFIDDVISQGVVAILCEEGASIDPKEIPIIEIPELRKQLGRIAARFYGEPTKDMSVFGITGTNGKTSCSHFLANVLFRMDHPCAIVGTLGAGLPGELKPSGFTSPDPITLQSELARLKAMGADAVAMEVSSHALTQHRFEAVSFDIAVFTNLSRDHLDYHGSMENYADAKRRLFQWPGLRAAVINVDDDFGRTLLQECADSKLHVLGYSVNGADAKVPMVRAVHIDFHDNGWTADIQTPSGQGLLKCGLLGRFNVSNVLAVLGVLELLKLPLDESLRCLEYLQTVPGRMQPFGGGKHPLVVVDYAHTPDALEQALSALREHCQGQLWCVFGCGGDRDQGKRSQMGEIAERYSDRLVITDDNPRSEDPQGIVDHITSGLLCPWAAEIEHDRRTAISHAIHCASAQDVILIAGKGHEAVQIIGKTEHPFNDAEEVMALIGEQ